MLKLKVSGLVVPDDSQKADIYTSLALKFIKDGTIIFTRDSLLKICNENKLIDNTYVKDDQKALVIGIRSFLRFAERIEDECGFHVCLAKYFIGRHIIDLSLWNCEIPNELSQFLSHDDLQIRLRSSDHSMLLECHGSIAFLVGYLLPRNSGSKVHPIQKGIDTKLWKPAGVTKTEWGWDIVNIDLRIDNPDIAIAISLTHNIITDVERFISTCGIPIRTIHHFTSKGDIGQDSLESPDHAIFLANDLLQRLRLFRKGNPHTTVHLFFAAPNGFMFLLGRSGLALGSIQLYEFDFCFERHGSYIPSIKIPL